MIQTLTPIHIHTRLAIFIILFLALRLIVDNQSALIYSYILAIIYGIIKNFHLLENFSQKYTDNNSIQNLIQRQLFRNSPSKLAKPDKNDSIEKSIENSSNPITARGISQPKKKTENSKHRLKNKLHTLINNINGNNPINKHNKNHSKNRKKNKKMNDILYTQPKITTSKDIKQNNTQTTHVLKKQIEHNAPDIEEIISEELLNKFIKRLKNEDELLVKKQKLNLYKINPSVNKLSKNKVEKMKTKFMNDDEFVKKPIIITNDNFILDGHHRWFARKSMIENNFNGFNTNGIYDENIRVIVIDFNN